jgi:hypothetical protein
MKPCIARFRGACLLILSLLVVGAGKPMPQNSPPKWFWGCWVVKRLLPVTDASGLSPKQEEAIIGKRLVFNPTCARSGGTVVHSPKYSVKVLSNREFFKKGYYIPLSQIGVHESSVTEVEVGLPSNLSDLDFPGNNVYLREKDIIIEVEGDYFAAEKAKPSDTACKCEQEKAE